MDTLGIVMQGGCDLVLPRADLHAQFPVPDFGGLWEYRCAKAGKAREYEHNGVCTFDVHVDEFGVSFKVLGERRWMIRDGVVNEQVLRWESNWGAVTAHDLVRFTYAVVGAEMEVGGETIEVQIQGYAYGHIRKEDDRPVRIEGKFFQLAPVFSLHGNLFFRRMANEYDTIWADRSADEMKS